MTAVEGAMTPFYGTAVLTRQMILDDLANGADDMTLGERLTLLWQSAHDAAVQQAEAAGVSLDPDRTTITIEVTSWPTGGAA